MRHATDWAAQRPGPSPSDWIVAYGDGEGLGFAGLITSDCVGVGRGEGAGSSLGGVIRGEGVTRTFALRLRAALALSFDPNSPTTLAGSELTFAGRGVGIVEGCG